MVNSGLVVSVVDIAAISVAERVHDGQVSRPFPPALFG